MKFLLAFLLVIFCALQYRVWFGSGSLQEVWRLQEQARNRAAYVAQLQSRNNALEAEVADLKRGLDAIEERARSELGMISKDETFYQFVRNRGKSNTTVVPLDFSSRSAPAPRVDQIGSQSSSQSSSQNGNRVGNQASD